MRLAVLALGDGRALDTVVVSSGSVDGAGLVGNVVIVHKFEGGVSFTTVAPIVIHGAGDDYLGGDVDVGPLCLSGNLDSVRHGGGGSLSPARAAILGNVLVLDVSQVVGSINVVPDPVVRKRLVFKRLGDLGEDGFGGLSAARHVSAAASES